MTSIGTLFRVAALALAVRAGAQAPQGWTFAVSISTDSGAAGGKVHMRMRMQATPNKTRIDITSSMMPETAAGFYQLLDAAEKSITSVMPSQHIVMLSPPRTLGGGMRIKMGASPQADAQDLGPGEKLLGFATRHYRVTNSYDTRGWFYGDSCTHTERAVADTWNSTDAGLTPETYQRIMRLGATDLVDSTTEAVLRALLRDGVKGIPLKSVSTVRRVSSEGDSTIVTTVFEMTELKQGEIDPAVFVVPAEFTVMDMRARAAEMNPAAMNPMVAAGIRKLYCDPAPSAVPPSP